MFCANKKWSNPWCNDAIHCIQVRGNGADKVDKCHSQQKPVGKEGIGKNWFANTYFYSKLMDRGTYNYGNVKRWTKNINIFECDRMIIPINVCTKTQPITEYLPPQNSCLHPSIRA